METLEHIGRKIRTAHDLLSVVKTMKAFAAVNIRQYEGAAESMNEYAAVIATGWQAFLKNRPQLQARKKKSETVCLVIGTDQGMCGQFNDTIIQYALSERKNADGLFGDTIFWTAGDRVRAGLQDEADLGEHFSLPSSTGAIADLIFEVVDRLVLLRESKEVESFVIFYNHLGRGGRYEPVLDQVLPLGPAWREQQRSSKWPTRCLPLMGAEPEPLLESLFRQHIFAAIYKAFAQSLASENAARFATMQAAEKNILEMEEGLQGRFRETRQNAITAELLDIISGFESMDSREG